jgi:acetyltransferase-like isoleucine patch superfamily enzyme
MSAGSALPHDWYPGLVPANALIDGGAHIDSTFGLARFDSNRSLSLELAEGAGLYGSTVLEVGPEGRVRIGPYSCLNSPYLVCNREISIGTHCLISWQVVISDTDLGPGISSKAHHAALGEAASHPDRILPPLVPPRPVVIEDAVWIGFGSVVLPGVTIGRGSVIGCKTVVDRDIPPGSVVVGNPARIVRTIDVPDPVHFAEMAGHPSG